MFIIHKDGLSPDAEEYGINLRGDEAELLYICGRYAYKGAISGEQIKRLIEIVGGSTIYTGIPGLGKADLNTLSKWDHLKAAALGRIFFDYLTTHNKNWKVEVSE